ncbi:MAG TPA: HEAT repeat domain-containing protein [Polyangiaceae bacterium]|nr:HEAT repeat domain-containing protein [Polyangiaceae bacterium]
MSKKERFPGYAACLAMMRKHDPSIQEAGFHALLPHAAEHVDALIQEFLTERDHGLRCWLLELIGEARSPKSLTLLIDELCSPDDSMRDWAARGLTVLNTHEARKALGESGWARAPRAAPASS